MRPRSLCRTTLAALLIGALGVACASAPSSSGRVVFLNPGTVLPAGLPFSEAVLAGDTLYLSGQIGLIPGTHDLVPGGIEAEARQTMENIAALLAANGFALRDVVKVTVMLEDITEWPAFNAVYASFFDDRYPARSALGADGLALGARVEVECIAVRSR